jgi:hypothetical protein
MKNEVKYDGYLNEQMHYINVARKIKYEKLEKAARELLFDVYKRHPGEKLRCKYMIELQHCLDML